jgi:ABC-type glycerol-3-phosphate transport system substrate-binding protein
MKNILKNRSLNLSIVLLSIAIFAGCGGGGGGSSASFESNTATAIVMCNATDTSWTALNSGDTVSATQTSQLKFDHDSSGEKKVCVVTGSATVLKG